MVRGPRRPRVSPAVEFRQRPHARPPGPSGELRAPDPPGDAHRAGRHDHRAARSHDGKRLNSPNDVVVRSDGTVWFTDPTYGISSDDEGGVSEQEQDGRYVFRLDPESGALAVAIDDFVQPNGLAFSPDETRLYVADSDDDRHIRAFDVAADGSCSGGAVFAVIDNGFPDGFRFDAAGNLWTSAADGIHCLAPDGVLLGKIAVPETVANLTFGGPARDRLFITATTALFTVPVAQTGAQRP